MLKSYNVQASILSADDDDDDDDYDDENNSIWSCVFLFY